jgi:hypothetical protein
LVEGELLPSLLPNAEGQNETGRHLRGVESASAAGISDVSRHLQPDFDQTADGTGLTPRLQPKTVMGVGSARGFALGFQINPISGIWQFHLPWVIPVMCL